MKTAKVNAALATPFRTSMHSTQLPCEGMATKAASWPFAISSRSAETHRFQQSDASRTPERTEHLASAAVAFVQSGNADIASAPLAYSRAGRVQGQKPVGCHELCHQE